MELPVRFVYSENKRMNYIDDLNRRWLDRRGDGRQRTTKIEDYRSGKIPL